MQDVIINENGHSEIILNTGTGLGNYYTWPNKNEKKTHKHINDDA